jgi:hypothetical protein
MIQKCLALVYLNRMNCPVLNFHPFFPQKDLDYCEDSPCFVSYHTDPYLNAGVISGFMIFKAFVCLLCLEI